MNTGSSGGRVVIAFPFLIVVFACLSPNTNAFSMGFFSDWKPLFAMANSSNISQDCRNGIEQFRNGVAQSDLWALKMLDASAKPPSGLLRGNINQFGDYDECLSVQEAQYCLTQIDIRSLSFKPYVQYRHLFHSHFYFHGEFDDPSHRIPDFTMAKWGLCLPSACRPQDIENFFTQTFGIASKVDEALCRKATEQMDDFTIGNYVAGGFFLALFLAILTSTLFYNKLRTSNDEPQRLLNGFALQTNWAILTKPWHCPDTNPNEIRAVHGIRALSALALYMCHKSVAIFYAPFINRTEAVEGLGKSWSVMGRTAVIYTDIFLFLSGLLSAHCLLVEMKRHNRLNFKDKLITRIFRVLPNMGALILLVTYVLPYINSGPLYPITVLQHGNFCRKNMWLNFLFMHNHLDFEKMCLTHTHQIGIDMQLFLLTPIVVLLWKRDKNVSLSLLILIALCSSVLRFWTTLQNDLSTVIYFAIPIRQMFKSSNMSYIRPSHRTTIYAMGILLAFLLENKRKPLHKFLVGIMWILTFSLGFWSMLGPYHMAQIEYVYNRWDAVIFNTISPICVGLGLMWTIYASLNGCAGWLGELLSWRGFQLFTKISYAFYLVQFPVFFYNVGIQRHVGEYHSHMLLPFSETLAVLVLSVMLTVCVELPFMNLKRVLIGDHKDSDRKRSRVKGQNKEIGVREKRG